MKAAKSNGKAHWYLECALSEDKTQEAVKTLLSTFQKVVCHLVNQSDTQSLIIMQRCCNEVFKQADICISEGKKMEVEK